MLWAHPIALYQHEKPNHCSNSVGNELVERNLEEIGDRIEIFGHRKAKARFEVSIPKSEDIHTTGIRRRMIRPFPTWGIRRLKDDGMDCSSISSEWASGYKRESPETQSQSEGFEATGVGFDMTTPENLQIEGGEEDYLENRNDLVDGRKRGVKITKG